MLNEKVADVFEQDKTAGGMIGSGYTYSGHPVGAAAAIACIAETKRLNVIENAASRGRQLHQGLSQLAQKHDIVGDVRGGHGLMCALELTADKATKSMPDKAVAAQIYKTTYENGVMVRVSGPNIILSPPLVITEAEVTGILNALDAGLASVNA